jgi:hypothetical protein
MRDHAHLIAIALAAVQRYKATAREAAGRLGLDPESIGDEMIIPMLDGQLLVAVEIDGTLTPATTIPAAEWRWEGEN